MNNRGLFFVSHGKAMHNLGPKLHGPKSLVRRKRFLTLSQAKDCEFHLAYMVNEFLNPMRFQSKSRSFLGSIN
jgi:hypothetical protein